MGISTNQILALLEETETANVLQVVIFPPGEEVHSNEDRGEEEEDPMDANHLGKGILKNQGEIEVDDKEDELPDIQEIDEDGEERGRVEDETAAEPEEAVEEPGPARKRGRPARPAAAYVEKLSRQRIVFLFCNIFTVLLNILILYKKTFLKNHLFNTVAKS